MNLEAQLLQIIEEHQQQLKEQQKQLEQALQLIQTQNRTIDELEKYNNELVKHCNQLREQSNELINIIKQLQNPKLSADLLKKFGEQLKTAIREPFKAVSNRLEHRESSRDDNREHLAEFGTSRDRNQIEATDRTSDRENEFSRAISTKSSGFNPTSIFEALDQLDQRRELQRAKEQTKKMTVAMIPQAHFNSL